MHDSARSRSLRRLTALLKRSAWWRTDNINATSLTTIRDKPALTGKAPSMIPFLFVLPFVAVVAQFALILAGFGEPYPAVMMRAFLAV